MNILNWFKTLIPKKRKPEYIGNEFLSTKDNYAYIIGYNTTLYKFMGCMVLYNHRY